MKRWNRWKQRQIRILCGADKSKRQSCLHCFLCRKYKICTCGSVAADGGDPEKKSKKYAKKGIRYWKTQGSAALVGKVAAKVRTASTREIPYQKWIVRHLPGPKELERQRREKFDFQPKISIVIPLYKTQEKYLRQLVETIKEQTYPNWELCLSDGSGANSPIAGLLESLAASDERIKVVSHEESLQILKIQMLRLRLQRVIILRLQIMMMN